MKNSNDYNYLIIGFILGFLLIISYIYVVKKVPIHILWANIPRQIRKLYYLSMILSLISAIYLFYFYIEQMPKSNQYNSIKGKSYTYFIFFILTSIIWPISILFNANKWITIFGLFLTALFVLLILIQIILYANDNLFKIFAILFASILLFQTLILDLFFWGYNYYSNNFKSNFGKKRIKKFAKRSNEALWKRIVQQVKNGSKGGNPGQWSARKAQLAVKLYKQKGGKYIGKKSKYNSLSKWTKENWGTRSGRNSVIGPKATGERYLPKKKRNKLTKKQYNKTSRKKREDWKKGIQYSSQPKY